MWEGDGTTCRENSVSYEVYFYLAETVICAVCIIHCDNCSDLNAQTIFQIHDTHNFGRALSGWATHLVIFKNLTAMVLMTSVDVSRNLQYHYQNIESYPLPKMECGSHMGVHRDLHLFM